MDFSFLERVPSGTWAIILTPLIMTLIMRLSKRPVKPLPDGSFVLGMTLGMYFLGFGVVLILVLCLAMFIVPFFDPPQSNELIILVVCEIILLPLSLYGFYYVFLIRARFNSEGLWFSGPRLKKFFAWKDMHKIVDSFYLGTYIQTDSGRLVVLKYRSGFPQFLELLIKNNVSGADDPSLLSA